MTYRTRLGFMFGGILIGVMLILAGVLYWQIRTTIVKKSADEAAALAATAAEKGERMAQTLSHTLEGMSRDVRLGILLREASDAGGSQRHLIDDLRRRVAEAGLNELTAVSADGIVLARGHRPAEFGDAAESMPIHIVHLQPGSTVLRLRVPVWLRARHVGDLEGGLDLSDELTELGRLFSGRVFLSTSPDTDMPATALPFHFVTSKSLSLSEGNVLADLVFSRDDGEAREIFQRLIFQAGLIFLGALVIGGFVVAQMSETVARPVRMLAQAAADYARNRKPPELPAITPDEIGDLTRSFSRMVVQIEESRQKLVATERLAAWQDAARMLAHEIKNPLSPIKTTATILARAAAEGDPKLSALVERGTAMVLTEISHLEKLLSEFSSFARFPSPQPVPADFNVEVRRVVETFRDREKGIRWVERYAQSPPNVQLDPGMFSEVVRNLLQNAMDSISLAESNRPVKEDEGERLIHIETTCENDKMILTIADSGPGVSEERREKLFTPYFTSKPGGTGLGLAVSRKIMIEHQGDLVLLDYSPFSDALGATFRASVPTAGVPS